MGLSDGAPEGEKVCDGLFVRTVGREVGSLVSSTGFNVTGAAETGLVDEGIGLTGGRVTGEADTMAVGVEVIGARVSTTGTDETMLGESVINDKPVGRLEGATVTG